MPEHQQREPNVCDPQAYLDLMNRLIELHRKGQLGIAASDVTLIAYALGAYTGDLLLAQRSALKAQPGVQA
jgi:hypothetical protein